MNHIKRCKSCSYLVELRPGNKCACKYFVDATGKFIDEDHKVPKYCAVYKEKEDLIETTKYSKLKHKYSKLKHIVKELMEEHNAEIERQENFAKQQGFTPDCSPYYIALQYRKRAEAAEEKLKENNKEKNNEISTYPR